MAKRKAGGGDKGVLAHEVVEAGPAAAERPTVPGGASNGNRQRGARSGWAVRRSRKSASERST